jgi:HK97 family phage prohead protease
MENRQKLSFAKSIDAEKKTITGYVSTYEWDRDQEAFVKGAWDFANYNKNPVVLWAHNPSLPPIGRNVDMIEDDFGVLATTEFDSKGELAMQVFDLFNRKFLNAFSVGFIRKNFEMRPLPNGEKGLAITDAELYEYSAVSVPANPGALVTREVAELAMKTISPGIIEVIATKSLGEQFLVLPTAPEIVDPNEPEAPADIEPVLKQLIDLAKIAKGTTMTDTKRGLITTAMTVFNEMLIDEKAKIDESEMDALKGILADFANVVSTVYPQAGAVIQKTISQIEKAVASRAA